MQTALLEILQSGADITLTVKSSDLHDFGRYLIDTATEETKQRLKAGEEDILLSIEDVMKRLSIRNRTTLWRWQKRGYLVPIKAGKKTLYRQSEVERVLNSKPA